MALVACLTAAPAQAEGVTVAGYGALSCAQALAALDNAAQSVHAGVYRDLANLNGELVAGSLRAFCAETPGAPLVTAAEKLFGSRLMRSSPKPR